MKRSNITYNKTSLKTKIFSSIAPENLLPGLEDRQIYGIMLASAIATRNLLFSTYIENIAREFIDEEAVSTAKFAVAFVELKGSHKNIFQLESDIVIEGDQDTQLLVSKQKDSPGKKTPINTYEDKNKYNTDFIMYVLAASFIDDFNYYTNFHQKLKERNTISKDVFKNIISIASTIQSIADIPLVEEIDQDKKIIDDKCNLKVKILVIDDEIRLTKLLKRTLENAGNFEVAVENVSTNAIGAAHKFNPDLILLDIMMPGIGGEEIAAQIKEDEGLKNIKIIFLSSLMTKSITGATGKSIRGNMYLSKPVNEKDLLQCIEKFLAMP